MPDITMCSGGECSRKEQCFRFTAKPGERQARFVEVPLKPDGTCEHFYGNCRCDYEKPVVFDGKVKWFCKHCGRAW